MGSGPSRGKKVAPAGVTEVNGTKASAGRVTSPKHDWRPFKPLRIHAVLRGSARNRAPPDCHSEGPESDFSDEDADRELEAVLADYDDTDSVKKPPAKKHFLRSRTYGLCHFSGEDTEDEGVPGPGVRAPGGGRGEEPRGSQPGSTDVNIRSKDAFTRLKTRAPAGVTQHHGFLTGGVLLDAVPCASDKQTSFGSCHGSSLTMPVILYDGSEEELMDTIEREFS